MTKTQKSAAEELASKRRRSRSANIRRGHVTVAGITRMAKEQDVHLSYLQKVRLKKVQDYIIEQIGDKASAVTSVRGAKTINFPSVVTAWMWVLGKNTAKTFVHPCSKSWLRSSRPQKKGQTCKVF